MCAHSEFETPISRKKFYHLETVDVHTTRVLFKACVDWHASNKLRCVSSKDAQNPRSGSRQQFAEAALNSSWLSKQGDPALTDITAHQEGLGTVTLPRSSACTYTLAEQPRMWFILKRTMYRSFIDNAWSFSTLNGKNYTRNILSNVLKVFWWMLWVLNVAIM